MRPAVVVRAFERAILAGAQLTTHARCSLLRFTLPAEPGTCRYCYNPVARLVHGDRTSLAVTINQRILVPTLLVRTYAATAYHHTHLSIYIYEAVMPEGRPDVEINLNLGRGPWS